MAIAITAFFVSLFGLIGLFALKHWEHTRGKTILPDTRRSVDTLAIRTKDTMLSHTEHLDRLPPYLLALLRAFVHVLATSFGQLAHLVGRRSHDLADLVSHKHHFERRETNSEFLRRVTEHTMRPENPRINTIRPIVDQASVAPVSVEAPKSETPAPMAQESPVSSVISDIQTDIVAEEELKPMQPSAERGRTEASRPNVQSKKPRARRTPRKQKNIDEAGSAPNQNLAE